MADKGWIKVYRQIQESAIWITEKPFDERSAWIDLIMMANIESKTVLYKGQTIVINRGDVYTSIRKLSNRWHWSTGKVSRYLNILTKLGMVKRKKSTKSATLLTLVKYEDFQSVRYRDKDTDRDTGKDTGGDSDGRLLKNIKNKKENKEAADQTSGEVVADVEEETPPVEGAVKMANGGWNYCPDIEWDDNE